MRAFATATLLILLLAPAVARADKVDDEYLKALGSVHGANLYNTYTAIGAVADGFVKKTYTKDEVLQHMGAQIGFIDALVKGLSELSEARGKELSPDDVAAIHEIQKIYLNLKAEADALADYARKTKTKDLERYDLARKTAWNRIEKLLSLKP